MCNLKQWLFKQVHCYLKHQLIKLIFNNNQEQHYNHKLYKLQLLFHHREQLQDQEHKFKAKFQLLKDFNLNHQFHSVLLPHLF
jgi:hypothetical protein